MTAWCTDQVRTRRAPPVGGLRSTNGNGNRECLMWSEASKQGAARRTVARAPVVC